jgi:Domain of unknown function (DUF4386)
MDRAGDPDMPRLADRTRAPVAVLCGASSAVHHVGPAGAEPNEVIKISSVFADTSAHQAHQPAIPQRQAAVIAGLAYVALNVLALFANFFVLERVTVPNDAAATVSKIVHSELLFRSGIAAFIVVLMADVVVAWALYVFLQPTSRELSLFAAWFRLVYVAIAGAALLNLLAVLKLVDGAGYATALEAGQRDVQVMLSLDAYISGWSIALVAFGVHLLLLGMVIAKSSHAPRILAILVAAAGVGYVLRHLAVVLLPNFEDYKDVSLLLLAVLAVPVEFGLPIWLLWRGGKKRVRDAPAL